MGNPLDGKGLTTSKTVPIKELDYNLNKKEFRDAIKLRYDCELTDKPKMWVCGVKFSVNRTVVCQLGGFIMRRDLEVEILRMVCNDVEEEQILQEVTGGTSNHSSNKAFMLVWIFMLEAFFGETEICIL